MKIPAHHQPGAIATMTWCPIHHYSRHTEVRILHVTQQIDGTYTLEVAVTETGYTLRKVRPETVTQLEVPQPKLTPKMVQIVSERYQALIADPDIRTIYNSFRDPQEADRWLVKAAIATLMIPPAQRTTQASQQ